MALSFACANRGLGVTTSASSLSSFLPPYLSPFFFFLPFFLQNKSQKYENLVKLWEIGTKTTHFRVDIVGIW